MQVFTSVMVLGLCFAAFIISDIKGYKERKTDSMISLANVIGLNSISAIDFLDNDAAKAILGDLRKISPDVVHATILDNKGNIFATYSKNGTGTYPFPRVQANKKFEFVRNHLLVYNTIINDNEITGTVCLRVELTELNAIKKQKYQIAYILLIVGLGVAFLIALAIQPYISKRLLSLVSIMNQVSKTGDYSKHVVVEGKDEITALSLVFNNLMDQIQESHKKKDEFIGIASHELKTPLTSIKAYLQVLDSIENNQPNKQYIEKALENVNKLQQLLLDLLDVSKIQSGQLQLNINEFNIDTLIDETIASSQIVSPNHQIVREGKPVNQVISADKQRIEQVLINLLSNATKYSPGAKKVILYTAKTVSAIIVGVKDFGIGIPKKEQSKVFERFYRTKELSKHHISGFGLGLYICRDIIERHKGKIWIESDGKGSVFYFSLPLQSSVAAAPSA
ncbi:MAG: ATP-binding protein [Ginsengibacter sp.]